MPRRNKKLPRIPKSQAYKVEEVRVPVRPPDAPVGEVMPIELMKGKVPATEQPDLIVWDNRQRIP